MSYSYAYPRPAVAVDMVVIAVGERGLELLLIERGEPPYRGRWALPGGFVRVRDDGDQGEDLDAAAARELHEETGLRPGDVYLQQLRAFGRPGRDTRGRVISIAYFALVPGDRLAVRGGDDAAEARWVALDRANELAFDHDEIVAFAVAELRRRLQHDPRIAASLVPAEFTKGELRRVIEILSGAVQDASNFNKRFTRMLDDGQVIALGRQRASTGPGRPAELFRFAQ